MLQRSESAKQNVFSEQLSKTELSVNDDKKMQPINSIESYPYEKSKDLLCKNENIKCSNITK